MASSSRWTMFCMFLLGLVVGAGICLLFVYGFMTWSQDLDDKRAKDRLKKFTYQHAAVAADNKICSDIGKNILENSEGVAGSAADAAIAAMVCTSIVNCHSSGIGGGHFSVAYNRNTGNITVVNARERAPLAAYKDMYRENANESKIGGLAIAVPGEVKGFYELWRLEGRLPWSRLFEPSIRLAREGFKIGGALSFAIESKAKQILQDDSLRNMFTDEKGNLLKQGNILKLPQLANTLEIIAVNGSHQSFYNGTLANTIAEEIRNATSASKTGVTLEDLQIYDANVEEPLQVQYGKLTMYSPKPPASGALASFILNILEGYYLTPCSASSNKQCNRPLQYHRFVEAFKFAYAERANVKDGVGTNITDMLTSKEYSDMVRRRISDDRTHPPEYYSDGSINGLYEEGGTAHVSVVDESGNAVAISSSINNYFGSLVLGPKTGIFYNNQMNDFAFNVSPLPANYIEPGKRPLSSMVPTIMVDDDDMARVIAGGAGSLSITTSTALVIANSLWFEDDVYTASDRPRLHYPFGDRPNYFVTYEKGVSSDIIDGLKLRGHNVTEHERLLSVIQLITRKDQNIYAKSDRRKAGYGQAGY